MVTASVSFGFVRSRSAMLFGERKLLQYWAEWRCSYDRDRTYNVPVRPIPIFRGRVSNIAEPDRTDQVRTPQWQCKVVTFDDKSLYDNLMAALPRAQFNFVQRHRD